MKGQTTLITGASSGIGWELAKVFAQHGHPLVLVARSVDKLKELAGKLHSDYQIRAHVVGADLTQADAPSNIAEQVHARNIEVDILVNNAGFALAGPFAELDTGRQLEMIAVNVRALTHLSRLFLPGMLQRNRGGILNVASTAAFQPGPLMAVYYASKAFVLSFTEALHEEVAGSALHVTCLCPGPTETRFAAGAGAQNTKLFRNGAGRADVVAQAAYKALVANEAIAIPDVGSKLLAVVAQFAPRPMVRKTAMTFNQ